MIATIFKNTVDAERAAADAESCGAPVISIAPSEGGWHVFVRVPDLATRQRLDAFFGGVSISRGKFETDVGF